MARPFSKKRNIVCQSYLVKNPRLYHEKQPTQPESKPGGIHQITISPTILETAKGKNDHVYQHVNPAILHQLSTQSSPTAQNFAKMKEKEGRILN